MRKIATLIAAFAISQSIAGIAIAQISNDFPDDSRIKVLKYDPDDIYVLTTLYGYQTNIVFDKRERIESISVGDKSLWQLIPSGNRLFIRPMEDNVQTNMTLLTNKHAYQFDLKSGAGAPEENPDLVYVARFVYPEAEPVIPVAPVNVAPVVVAEPVATIVPVEEAVVAPVEPAPAVSTVAPVTVTAPMAGNLPPQGKRNYNYTFTGADSLAPVEVFDDGEATYIRFADMTRNLPKVYLRQADGNMLQLPVTRQHGYLVVGKVATMLDLADAKEALTLYNESLLAEVP